MQDHGFCFCLIQGEDTAFYLIVSGKTAVAAAVGTEAGDIEGGINLSSSAETKVV